MKLDSILDDLDLFYTVSLEESLGESDRKFISDKMVEIATSCKYWLDNCKNLTTDLRIRFQRIKKYADETIAEIEKGYDVLLHWTAMRAAILDQLAELKKGPNRSHATEVA